MIFEVPIETLPYDYSSMFTTSFPSIRVHLPPIEEKADEDPFPISTGDVPSPILAECLDNAPTTSPTITESGEPCVDEMEQRFFDFSISSPAVPPPVFQLNAGCTTVVPIKAAESISTVIRAEQVQDESITIEPEKIINNPNVNTDLTEAEINEEHLLLMSGFSSIQTEDFGRFFLWRKISQQAALIGRSWSENSI